ncbi:MAG TPA: nickel-dependent hydrogenase large subunit [Ruminiclostridium sp.]|nr:nickel-dependent hydrogenase large subunit [Ruminiclostridium sp.]
MTRRIVINPVTRISGFMEVDVTVENNMVADTKTEGLLFRGFEKMLVGRNPLDAVYFTQRICGICSTAHSVASALALEAAMGVVPSEQGRYLRDILHGCEFLQNHIRHFYQYTIPDFVRLPGKYPLYATDHNDFRLPQDKNDEISRNYFESLDISRSAHEMLAVLGGKAPHNHGIFVGGITAQATADRIIKIKSILHTVRQFIVDRMIPDAYTIARYYGEYYKIGGGYGNFLSYGCFNGYKELGTLYVNPLEYTLGKVSVFNSGGITEEIDYSWYQDTVDEYKPMDTVPEADMSKSQAYSWVKAPRYKGMAYEVGPLARQWLSGEYRNGISVMDRTIARVLEAKKIAEVTGILLENLTPGVSVQKEYTIPTASAGAGLIDTTRGALGHWLKINDGSLSFYQIITPSAWNLSTRGNNSLKGTAEQALMNTTIKDIDTPVELGRILRSFDPCVSCATHVYSQGECIKTIKAVP